MYAYMSNKYNGTCTKKNQCTSLKKDQNL
jgi:hypothetical protein